MNRQFVFQTEPFEFFPEMQYESDFEDWESKAPSKPASTTTCPRYDPGEEMKSRTQGFLPSDVIEDPRGLLIADFGVDWRTPKPSVKNDPVLKRWLNEIIQVVRANPSTKIRILGFSDCAGKEKNNRELRRGRALRVYQLLYQLLGTSSQGRSLRTRIKFEGAPIGDYVADNSSIEGRAKNRGVLIENTRVVEFPPENVPTKPQPKPSGPCGFAPSRHGFKFGNSFVLPDVITKVLDKLGINVGSRKVYGLCGGMSFLAADFFHFGIPVPNTSVVPPLGSSLYKKLLDRQIDSLKLNAARAILGGLSALGGLVGSVPLSLLRSGFAEPVLKFWGWMGLPDRGRGSIAEKTTAEITTINSILRSGKFAVLGLVLTNRSGALDDNHQVLAYCVMQRAPNHFLYSIYDPNCPLRDDIRIEVKIVGGGAQAVYVDPSPVCNTDEYSRPKIPTIRGIFNMPYLPVKP